MLFMFILSYIAFAIQFLFSTLAIAAALYYLAEFVEEQTVLAKNIIFCFILISSSVHVGLMIFEDIPLWVNSLGILSQIFHGLLLRDFPVVRVYSAAFIATVVLILTNHYMAFKSFAILPYAFSEVLAYFTLCLWLVPFSLFVSLSANDNVLPTLGERQPLLGDNNVVTDYFSRKRKKYGLLTFFSFAKDSILPVRSKKTF